MAQATAQVSGNLSLGSGQTGDAAFVSLLASLFNATNLLIEPAASIGSSPVTVVLPGARTKVVFVQNNHATQTVDVTWTLFGGASVDVIVLQPGEFILLGGVTGSSGGISALILTGSGAATTTKILAAS